MEGTTTIPIDVTGATTAEPLRESIRRQGDVIRHPEGYPEGLVFRALAYVYAAYALGSRTAAAELDEHLRRYPRADRPSAAVAMGMAKGFLRLAEDHSSR